MPYEVNKTKLLYENETFQLNGIAFKVQKELGRFAKEKQYCDLYEKYLIKDKVPYQRELTIGDTGNRLDFFVFNHILLDMKAKPYILKEDSYIKPKRILRETRKDPQLSVNQDNIRRSGLET